MAGRAFKVVDIRNSEQVAASINH